MKPTFLLALFGGFSFSNTIGVNTNARILDYCYNRDQNIFKLSSLSALCLRLIILKDS